jgi:ABC-type transport system involved in multi-copper enzyme maturation permease subunit
LNVAAQLVGPLAGPECRRAVARGWLIVVRALAAVALLGVALVVVWWWWVFRQTDPFHQPFYELRIGLTAVEGLMVAIALIQGPAVLAGSLAGEKQRGVLSLLLSTRVNAWEVVSGRLVGKLTQVGMILLAGVPSLILLGALAGLRPLILMTLIAVPAAVGFGGGGLAVLASALSRRGRDALLTVYLIDLLFLLTPLATRFGLPAGSFDWLPALNPFTTVGALVWDENLPAALVTLGLWLAIGLVATGVAAWRLRPACLAATDGEASGRRTARRGWVPPVDERRPMLWKELFVERVATLGRFGRWVGLLITVGLLGLSLGMTAVLVADAMVFHGYAWGDWARDQITIWIAGSATLIGFLLQWAIGLRAGVSISSERERGTWDALLTSPLEAREIVRGKLWGSLYALRWMVGAAFVAWVLAAATGADDVTTVVTLCADVLVIGAFMAAVGVRTSLACQTATRAMAVTVGVWLGAFVVAAVLTFVTLLLGLFLCNAARIVLSWLGLLPPLTTLWFPMAWSVAWPLAKDSLYLLATVLIVVDTRLRFDRVAGRMTEGSVAVAFDRMIYGLPEAPVPAPVQVPEKVESLVDDGFA